MNSHAMYFTPVRYGGFSDYLGVFIGYFQYYLYWHHNHSFEKIYFHNVPKEIKKGKTTKYLLLYWELPIMLKQHLVNSDKLFNTQSRVLQDDRLLLKNHERVTLNINMINYGGSFLLT